jgi:hypothetical protein
MLYFTITYRPRTLELEELRRVAPLKRGASERKSGDRSGVDWIPTILASPTPPDESRLKVRKQERRLLPRGKG